MGIISNAKYIELGKQAENNAIANSAITAIAPHIEKEAIRRAAPVIQNDVIHNIAPAIYKSATNNVLAQLGIHPTSGQSPVGLSTYNLQ